jgi:hypothetical protein
MEFRRRVIVCIEFVLSHCEVKQLNIHIFSFESDIFSGEIRTEAN